MTAHHKKLVYGGLIIVGGIVVIYWMKNYLTNKGVIPGATTTPLPSDPLGVGQLKLQSWFTTALNAQPGTTAFPSQLQ